MLLLKFNVIFFVHFSLHLWIQKSAYFQVIYICILHMYSRISSCHNFSNELLLDWVYGVYEVMFDNNMWKLFTSWLYYLICYQAALYIAIRLEYWIYSLTFRCMVAFLWKWHYDTVWPYAAAFALPGELGLAFPPFSYPRR